MKATTEVENQEEHQLREEEKTTHHEEESGFIFPGEESEHEEQLQTETLQQQIDKIFVRAVQSQPLNIEELLALIAEGANPNCREFRGPGLDEGSSAIHYLVLNKRYDDLELFLENIPKLFIDNAANQEDVRTEAQIHQELQKTYSGYVQGNTRYDFQLAELRSKSRGGTALDLAVRKEDARAVFLLIKYGANLERLNETGLDHEDGIGSREYSTIITNLWLYCQDDHSVSPNGISYLNLAYKEIIRRTPFEKLKDDLIFLTLDERNTDPKYRGSMALPTRRNIFDYVIKIAEEIYGHELLAPYINARMQEQHNQSRRFSWSPLFGAATKLPSPSGTYGPKEDKRTRTGSFLSNSFSSLRRKSRGSFNDLTTLAALQTPSVDEKQNLLDEAFVQAIKTLPMNLTHIKELIKQGANPNCNKFGEGEGQEIKFGSCAIHYLIYHKRYNDLDLFLTKIPGIFVDNPFNQKDSRIDELIHKELRKSVSGYNPGSPRFELSFATLLNKRQGGSALEEALPNGDARAVFILVKHGANIEKFRDQPESYGVFQGGRQYSSIVTDFFPYCKQDEHRIAGGAQYKVMAAREIIKRTSFENLCQDFNFLLMTKEEERQQLAYSTGAPSERTKQETFEFMFTIAKEFYTPQALQEFHDKAAAKGWEVDARPFTPTRFSLSSLVRTPLRSPIFSSSKEKEVESSHRSSFSFFGSRSREGSFIERTQSKSRRNSMDIESGVPPFVLEAPPSSIMQTLHKQESVVRQLSFKDDKKQTQPSLPDI